MKVRDIDVRDVINGKNWRLKEESDVDLNIVDWEIEPCENFNVKDTVVYSGLSIRKSGEVRPLLLIREIDSYEWWGDSCEYNEGEWRELTQSDNPDDWDIETYIAMPLQGDPSFVGEYSHEKQRAGFVKWRDRLRLTR